MQKYLSTSALNWSNYFVNDTGAMITKINICSIKTVVPKLFTARTPLDI